MIFKQHKWVWIIYSLISIIALVVALIISATLSMWDITFAFLIIAPSVGLSWYVKFFNQKKLNEMAEEYKAKKNIMRTSIVWSLISSFIVFIPIIIAIIVKALGYNYFNFYMILALVVTYIGSFYVVKIIEYKKANKELEK